jgi:hypothetical protein
MTYLIAKQDFAFTPQRKHARRVVVRAGQRFWITNSQVNQRETGLVMIDRYGKGCISNGYPFAPAHIEQLFAAA